MKWLIDDNKLPQGKKLIHVKSWAEHCYHKSHPLNNFLKFVEKKDLPSVTVKCVAIFKENNSFIRDSKFYGYAFLVLMVGKMKIELSSSYLTLEEFIEGIVREVTSWSRDFHCSTIMDL